MTSIWDRVLLDVSPHLQLQYTYLLYKCRQAVSIHSADRQHIPHQYLALQVVRVAA